MKTNAEMLRTIIEYAVERGWDGKTNKSLTVYMKGEIRYPGDFINPVEDVNILHDSVNDILFSHSFAKCVFGEGYVCSDCGYMLNKPHISNNPNIKPDELPHAYTILSWQHHLKKCVISPDPILYYYNFVTERREG